MFAVVTLGPLWLFVKNLPALRPGELVSMILVTPTCFLALQYFVLSLLQKLVSEL